MTKAESGNQLKQNNIGFKFAKSWYLFPEEAVFLLDLGLLRAFSPIEPINYQEFDDFLDSLKESRV